jgi:hypothetical protein
MDNVKTASFGDKRGAKQTVIDAIEAAEDSEVAVIILLRTDGSVACAWSDGSYLKRMGMCDVAKLQMTEDAYE